MVVQCTILRARSLALDCLHPPPFRFLLVLLYAGTDHLFVAMGDHGLSHSLDSLKWWYNAKMA
jgi:hypothetical protein